MTILHNKEDFKWKDNLKVFDVSELELILAKSEERIDCLFEVGVRIRNNCITIINWAIVVLASMIGILCKEIYIDTSPTLDFVILCIYGIICTLIIIGILTRGVIYEVRTYLKGLSPDLMITKGSVEIYQTRISQEKSKRHFFLSYLISNYDKRYKQINDENERRLSYYQGAIYFMFASLLGGLVLIFVLCLV